MSILVFVHAPLFGTNVIYFKCIQLKSHTQTIHSQKKCAPLIQSLVQIYKHQNICVFLMNPLVKLSGRCFIICLPTQDYTIKARSIAITCHVILNWHFVGHDPYCLYAQSLIALPSTNCHQNIALKTACICVPMLKPQFQ